MSKNKRAYRKVALLAILTLIIVVSASCGKTKNKAKKSYKTMTPKETVKESSLTGIITGIDTDARQFTIRGLNSDNDTMLNYGETSVITNKFGVEIEGDELQNGQIFEAKYEPGNTKVTSMSVPDDVWEYQDVSSFSINTDINALKFAGQKFQYSDATYYSEDGKAIGIIDLNNKDTITVRGIGVQVYSVVKSAGHGYIKLANYKDFIGGNVSVGNKIFLPVTKKMLIAAGVGDYKVTLTKGKETTSKNVTVHNEKTVTLDFGDYVPKVSNIGNIRFKIEPAGADLYINGKMVDYSKPIALKYGEYKIKAELTGYSTYNGVLDVEDESKTINIGLTEASEAEPTPSPIHSATPVPLTTPTPDIVTKKTDSKHKISVAGPEGAAVYLDNVYQGIAPCEFTKIIGSQTITLSKSGYVSKSYPVNILDNGKDIKFDFPELSENSEISEDNSDTKTESTSNPQ